MSSISSNHSISDDFFADLYETSAAKVAIVATAAILVPINIVFLYSIIWYEHYGVDLKRTVINKSIASMCWVGLALELLFCFNFWRYTIGPLNYTVCFAKTFLVYALSMAAYMFIDLSLIARYFYIFVLKNPAAVHDDFWSLYMNMVIPSFCVLSQAVHMILPGKRTVEFHLCTSTDPNEGNLLPRRNISMSFVFLATLIINILIPGRIRIYQLKYKKSERKKMTSTT